VAFFEEFCPNEEIRVLNEDGSVKMTSKGPKYINIREMKKKLAKGHKDKVHEFDLLLKVHGHIPVRTPPHMPKHQAMELFFGWEKHTLCTNSYHLTWKDKRAWFTLVCKQLGEHPTHLLSFRDHCARLRHEDWLEVKEKLHKNPLIIHLSDSEMSEEDSEEDSEEEN